MRNPTLALIGAAALVALAGGCESPRGYYDEPVRHSYIDQRVYYYDPYDVDSVYFFERERPDVIVQRRCFREPDGRVYYIEPNFGSDARVYYDDKAARGRGPPPGRGHGRGPPG